MTPVLRQLHWLPIEVQAQFKVLVITYKALNGLGPGYLKERLRPYMPARPLRSAGEALLREPSVAYGTTENSPVTFMGFPQDNLVQKTETVGCIFPHTEAKIEDPNTAEILPLNSPGELQVRGYCVMLGYWADPSKTSEVLDDEKWYKTGDIAVLDEYGYCKIVGRCKDMIIRGGENIYPSELEQFLHTHPKIQEVQVVGVKDERMGEEICASVRLKAGEECTAEELKAFCKGKRGTEMLWTKCILTKCLMRAPIIELIKHGLKSTNRIAHFKIPRYIVFVKHYPLTVSGKLRKCGDLKSQLALCTADACGQGGFSFGFS
ncbi:Acyl-CoA synthetase family member 2, mitochondrial [Varanus komodoensis]|nr:Acyl-CoA synthetase family member 2, mitochondrial [Varanus komodoensis]